MKYETIWNAVDNLARSLKLTTSGLAKKAGLDSTTFNKCKRIRPDGKLRWPSLDSINKVLEYCNISFDEFYKYGEGEKCVPTIPFASLSRNFSPQSDENAPDTSDWENIPFPLGANNTYALEIDTTDYEPVYKQNTLILLLKNSEIRKGDKIGVFLKSGEIMLAEFVRRKPDCIVIQSLKNVWLETSVNIADIAYVNRICWISQ